MGAPLEQLWPLTPAWAPEALLCPLAQSPVPSLAPSSAPVASKQRKVPWCPRAALGMLVSRPSHGTSRALREVFQL